MSKNKVFNLDKEIKIFDSEGKEIGTVIAIDGIKLEDVSRDVSEGNRPSEMYPGKLSHTLEINLKGVIQLENKSKTV